MSVRLLRILSPYLPLTDQPAPLDVSLVTNTNTSTVITVGVSICKIFSPEFNSDHCGGRQCSGRILSASGIFYSFKQSSIYLHSPPTNTCELVLSSPDDSMFWQQKVRVSAELTFNPRVANGGSRVLPIQSVVSCLSYFVIPPLSSPEFSVLMDFCYSSTCFYSPQLSIYSCRWK